MYTPKNGVFEQPGGEPVDGYLQLNEGADDVVLNVVDTRTGQLINQMSLGPQRAGEVPLLGTVVISPEVQLNQDGMPSSLKQFAKAKVNR